MISFEVDTPGRLDQFLVARTSLTRMFLKEQIEAGAVRLNGTSVRKAATKVRVGDHVECEFREEKPLDLVPVAGPLDILYEDESLLALNKRQGQVVHPATGHRGETLVHYLLHHFRKDHDFASLSPDRPGIVHRLDRGTSGVILIAKNRATQAALSRQFKDREVKKEYEAIVWGKLPEKGTWRNAIGRHRSDRKKMSSKTVKGRAALTQWVRLATFGHFSHVKLQPHTGRTHQLRVHLTEAGHPIVGDSLYGSSSLPRRLSTLSPILLSAIEAQKETLLHARRLELTHPVTGSALVFEAPRPETFDKILALLEKEDP